MARKEDLTERQQAERRYQSLVEKRDHFNVEARAVREERDLLNRKKAQVRQQANAIRDRRSRLLKEVRDHKAKRNDLQRRAKELIQIKGKLRGRLKGGVEAQVQKRRDQATKLETQQQTQSLSLTEESRLLENLRGARKELAELEALQREHESVLREVGDVDVAIDDHFQRAEAEHQEVVAKSEQAQAHRRELDEKLDEVSVLIAEANRIHKLFVKVRERADHFHQRAMEMRKEIISIKRSRRQERAEAKALVKRQKAVVREALEDEEKLDEAADEAIATLRKGGKLEL
ncbi:MAG: hypothetical protein LN410_03585 [Candidatus Thermoplasmatota archaeon]|nr:hypothetical protein [Candidatus Thermoplasmatota archaeon]